MIKPFYFPNIYIAKDVSEILKHFFEHVYVYGVSAPGLTENSIKCEKGFCEIITPAFNDEDQFNEFLLTGFNSKPLYDPNRAFELTAELQRRVDDASIEDDSSLLDKYRIMRARVFLQMAYEYDTQSSLIQKELLECKKREQELIKELQGFEEVEMKLPAVGEEAHQRYSIDFQSEKRFESWIDIFVKSLEEDDKSDSGFYITDMISIIETLIDFEPELERVCCLRPEMISKEDLLTLIKQLTTCDWKADKELLIEEYSLKNDTQAESISLYIYPEKDPEDLFLKFASVNNRAETLFEHRKRIRNTVIGCVNM